MWSIASSILALWSLGLHCEPVRQVTVGVLGYVTEAKARLVEGSLADELRARPGRTAVSYRVTVFHTAYNDTDMNAAVGRLRSLRPDIVLVDSPVLVELVLRQTHEVPIVSAGEAIIENLPYVHSVAHPGGRVTGFFRRVNQLSKNIELLQGFCPGVRKIGLVTTVNAASDSVFLGYLEHESMLLRHSGITIVPLYLRVDQFPSLPALIRENDLDALEIGYSLAVRDHLPAIRNIVGALGIPHVYTHVQAVENGGAFAVQPATFDFVKTGAEYIVRIAHGEKAGDIPIQISRAYDIVIDTQRIQDFKGCDPRRIARIATRFYPQ